MKKFSEIQDIINSNYNYEPNGFTVGNNYNNKDMNQWAGRVLSYSILNNLTTKEALELFGEHYQDVLNNPSGSNHSNIRALIENGLDSVKFDNNKLLISKNNG